MKNMLQRLFITLVMLSTLNTQLSTLHAQGTAFTYQGRLNNGGGAANGSYDLTFTLFATNTSGIAIAGPVTNTAVGVTNGLFTTLVDFGLGAFIGTSNWLEIAVSTNAANNFTTLAPRQQLTPVPYAITAANVSGTISAAQLPAAVVTNGASGVSFSGTFNGNGTGLSVPSNVITQNESGVTLNGTFTGTGTGLTTVTAGNYVFAYDTTTQTIASQNTFQNITVNNYSTQINGWTHTPGTAVFTCAQSGIYMVQYVAESTSFDIIDNDVITVRALLNSVEIPGSAAVGYIYSYSENPYSQDQKEITKSFIVSITSGSALVFQVADATSNLGSIAPAGSATTRSSFSCTIIRIQ